jgi:hypothetical protein
MAAIVEVTFATIIETAGMRAGTNGRGERVKGKG